MWPLSKQALEHLFDVETRVLGVARAQGDVLQIEKNGHRGIRGLWQAFTNPSCLEPVVVEAYADSLCLDAVGRDFVPQPAFEQHQVPGRRPDRSPRDAFRAARDRLARRRRHETVQARIFEFDARGSGALERSRCRSTSSSGCRCSVCTVPRGMMLTQQSVISSSRPRNPIRPPRQRRRRDAEALLAASRKSVRSSCRRCADP